MAIDAELILRKTVFEHLDDVLAGKGTLTRKELEDFQIGGQPRKLIDRNKGIWNPRDLKATLSIMSSSDGPYDDVQISESTFAYAYRQGNVNGDNTKLRRAFELKLPIIWFRRIRDAVFVPTYPVYVIADDKPNERFLVSYTEQAEPDLSEADPLQRDYALRTTKQRRHQPEFRGRVLLAYDYRCTACGLTPARLLDAAHIIGDSKTEGVPSTDNGLSLCKIHHAAYDADYLGISPDSEIHIQPAIMRVAGDSMLTYSLQRLNGTRLIPPSKKKDHPSPERLATRFAEFTANSH